MNIIVKNIVWMGKNMLQDVNVFVKIHKKEEILNSGKFGCSECYNLFRDIAENYVNTRGYLSHKGKKPAQNGTQTEKTNVNLKNNNAKSEMSKIDKLKAELALAVKEERFLDCDKIAKQIAALQKEEK